ncbi:thiamine pyrophosphate-binding protein [Neorhizobium alkalisoli]|uniref:Thiamine pyrophosphate-binding protein n=1 Tax=Neorhizobium alkalisoli TaxID=528178 RepID=A0A561Q827_9HYPH|nr:thiamine pyrophosphate-binding protein [Neorhizobium alkalisoli]TWF46523.1 hypothetical protein FHW37_11492 [Neorhizobium alkalisoli]
MTEARIKPNPHAGLPGGKRRWPFHLSILLLLMPALLVPNYFRQVALFSGTGGLGERKLGEITIGPWKAQLAEFSVEEPLDQGLAGHIKSFALGLEPESATHVKASYMRVGKPRTLRAAGAIFYGPPYRQLVDLPIPQRTEPGERLWLTMEGWDGSVHQASIALSEASPVTEAWLAKQKGTR